MVCHPPASPALSPQSPQLSSQSRGTLQPQGHILVVHLQMSHRGNLLPDKPSVCCGLWACPHHHSLVRRPKEMCPNVLRFPIQARLGPGATSASWADRSS